MALDGKRISMGSLKARVNACLKADDFEKELTECTKLPALRVVNFLFANLYNPDQFYKMRAVKAMGAVVANLAKDDLEAARVIMRRLMWNLNDESGGIGWGSPEAMGEIMAMSEKLAREYAHVLVSYLREDGNYLEHHMLQRGVLWGMARLSEVRPELLRDSVKFVSPFLQSKDPVLQGLAARVFDLLEAD